MKKIMRCGRGGGGSGRSTGSSRPSPFARRSNSDRVNNTAEQAALSGSRFGGGRARGTGRAFNPRNF